MTEQPPGAQLPAWPADWVVPDWPAPPQVRAVITARSGGVSQGPWASPDGGGMNLGLKSGEERAVIERNRAMLGQWLPAPPAWLEQVHGAVVVEAERGAGQQADAATAVTAGVVCAVTIADCLPVLLTEIHGRGVAAVHAGWRGLAGGVIQNTAQALRARLGEPHARLLAYLGPAIGPAQFEVGAEVLEAMQRRLPQAGAAFSALPVAGKYRADLYALARQALAQVDVHAVYGGTLCTVSDERRFYSYRRDRVTGRHAAVIWRNAQDGQSPA